MASNASDNCQTNTSTLSTACFDPIAPINLQRASDHSLDGNTDASTTDFQADKYADVNWKRLLGYHRGTRKAYMVKITGNAWVTLFKGLGRYCMWTSEYFYIISKASIFFNQLNSIRISRLNTLPSPRALSWLNWLSLGIQFNSILKPRWMICNPALVQPVINFNSLFNKLSYIT